MLIKLEWLGYRVVKKPWRYVKPYSQNTGTWRTDGRTKSIYQYRSSTFSASAGNRQRLQTVSISSVTATEDLHKQSKNRHISTSGLTKKSLKPAQPKSMGYIITAISQIYKSIVTHFNVNSLTATGSETNGIHDVAISPLPIWRNSRSNFHSHLGYFITAISQIYKSIVTDFNTNSSSATGSETDAIEKSPYFYFRLDENLAQTCTAKVNGII